jgi:hypothetical protein
MTKIFFMLVGQSFAPAALPRCWSIAGPVKGFYSYIQLNGKSECRQIHESGALVRLDPIIPPWVKRENLVRVLASVTTHQ